MVACFAASSPEACPVLAVDPATWETVAAQLTPEQRAYAGAARFEPKPGRHLVLPGPDGRIAAVLFGLTPAGERGFDPLAPGRLATLLPEGEYQLAGTWPEPALAALGWALSAYRFTRYKAPGGAVATLCVPPGLDGARLERIVEGVTLARDLVNTPANDLGPDALEAAALALATRHGAEIRVPRGEALREAFPLIHAVGRAAAEEPRLVDFSWGPMDAPKVTLVGKGVTFDTGGLDIKPDAAMLLMKKDMAGSATALALAHMVMDAGLRVRLRVLLPIVENAISASAFRPGDIYRSRKGLTVEIGNTDDDELAAAVQRFGRAAHDPVWRMPLWAPYDALLDGKIADLNNVSGGPFAGSVTAALFLRRFVDPDVAWAHFDIYGWNPSAKPGRPEGGETQAARLLYDLLSERYPA